MFKIRIFILLGLFLSLLQACSGMAMAEEFKTLSLVLSGRGLQTSQVNIPPGYRPATASLACSLAEPFSGKASITVLAGESKAVFSSDTPKTADLELGNLAVSALPVSANGYLTGYYTVAIEVKCVKTSAN